MTVGQTAVSQQTHVNYDNFTVIIPGNKLKVSRRDAYRFQSKVRREEKKKSFHK